MDPILDKEIQNLIDLKLGDTHRLEFIRESMKNEKKIYNSDQKYLIELLQTHSKVEDILERLDFLNPKPVKKSTEKVVDLDTHTLKRDTLPQKFGRPTGITILTILSVVSIVYSLVAWMYYGGMSPLLFYSIPFISSLITFFYLLLMAFNIIIIIGLSSGKAWGRKIVLILGWIGLITSIISFNPVGIIISGIIVWYLRKSHVKEYFGVEF